MPQFNNELHGALFKNDKGDNPKRPDYRGTVQVAGVVYNVSAWIQKDKAMNTYMSMKLSAKVAEPLTTPVNDGAPFNDDIPF